MTSSTVLPGKDQRWAADIDYFTKFWDAFWNLFISSPWSSSSSCYNVNAQTETQVDLRKLSSNYYIRLLKTTNVFCGGSRNSSWKFKFLFDHGSATLSLTGCSIKNCSKAKNLIGNPTWDPVETRGNKVLKSICPPWNAFYISFLPLLQWTNPDKGLKADTAPRQR